MDWFLRWGNWAVAKLIEVLFNTNHLSDVGCTYRVLRKPMAEHVARNMRVGGSHAGVEIMLLTITSGARYVEVPLNYLPRVGLSSVTGKRLMAIAVGAADDRADPAPPAPVPAQAGAAPGLRGRPRRGGRRGA